MLSIRKIPKIDNFLSHSLAFQAEQHIIAPITQNQQERHSLKETSSKEHSYWRSVLQDDERARIINSRKFIFSCERERYFEIGIESGE